MNPKATHLIQQIHDHPARAVVVVTGAGTLGLSWLFGVAGASRTMLEARVPYSAAAYRDFIGREPRKYVSAGAARFLAGSALQRARFLARDGRPPVGEPAEGALIGLACTATISTDYVKRGEHRAFVATWTPERVVTAGLIMDKGRRDRAGEEDLVSRLIINALAEACSLPGRLAMPLVAQDETWREEFRLDEGVGRLLNEATPFVGIYADGRVKDGEIRPQVLLPGSFNPLHDGHRELAEAAATWLERPVAFELSAFNVDKPPLDQGIILSRLAQFAGRQPVYLTNAPTFIEKARLFPGVTFVVGYDTAVRILAPRYYGHSPEKMIDALAEMRDLGVHFLVAGRADEAGTFHTAAELEVPAPFGDLFSALPANRFRHDISSTAIRQALS